MCTYNYCFMYFKPQKLYHISKYDYVCQYRMFCIKMFSYLVCNYFPVTGIPTLTSLDQRSSTTVRVRWSPPSGGARVTSYVVHYRTSSSLTIKRISSSSTSTDITGLTAGATYTISVEATSQHLSGESEEVTITSWHYSCIVVLTC